MTTEQTVREVFDPTFEAIGDSELNYDQKRALLYNLYCFACAVCPEYVAAPSNTLFEYGCCFLIEPERHPDYVAGDPRFVHGGASSDALAVGGRWYGRRGKYFIKYDFGSELFKRLVMSEVIPPQDREPIPTVSLYSAVFLCCNMFEHLRPLWHVYYFYLDATNEPVDEEFDGRLWELLRKDKVYAAAQEVCGSMLIGDENELDGAPKLLDFYKPFIDYRREHIFEVFEKRVASGDNEFVAEYSDALLKCYPESVNLMNWNAAARTELVVRSRDPKMLDALIRDLREYVKSASSPTLDKYLKLAVLMKKNLE